MIKRNYQKEMDIIINTLKTENIIPKLMLHSCCAPCSSYVIEYLSEYFNITVLYYNPNIYPDCEYEKRSNEQEKYISSIKTKNKVKFIKGEYDKKLFYSAVKGLENESECGKRCIKCYELRLLMTAKKAKENNYDYFATTLTISPMKKAEVINSIGDEISNIVGVNYLSSDFKKKDGYKRSVKLSSDYGIYRQNYCGCIYSQRNK